MELMEIDVFSRQHEQKRMTGGRSDRELFNIVCIELDV